jgi:phage major head subunit gpT-like protein
MDINAAGLATIRRMIVTAWQKGLEWKPPVDLSFLFSDFPSTTESNFYPWMDLTPKFREWLGDRVFNNIRSNFFAVLNRIFEKSERMPATLIKDDKWQTYMPIFGMYGAAWQQLLYDLVVEVLTGNPLTYTGKALFATDHAYGDYTISNLVTDALSKTSFEAAFTTSAGWQFSNGVYVRPKWTHLLVGEKMRPTGHAIVVAEKISEGGVQIDNPNRGRAQMVVLPDYAGTYDDYWTLVDASGPIHAIARQLRESPNPMMDDDPLHVERTGNFDWMASGRAAAAPTFPHLVYGGRL